MSEFRDAAFDYARRGWSPFPLQERDKTPWPLFPVKTYQRERRATEHEITVWWRDVPNANVAIATGAISGFFVVDCDTIDAFNTIREQGWLLPPMIVASARGYHLYFKCPAFPVGNRTNILPGVDIRGDGGYVVAPPSIHPSGAQYRWVNEARLSPAPLWLLRVLRAKDKGAVLLPRFVPQSGSKYAEVALRRELDGLLSAPEGERNSQLNRSSFCLGELIAGQELTDAEVIAELYNAALAIGLMPKEIMPTILSGMNAGKRYPRSRTKRTVRS